MMETSSTAISTVPLIILPSDNMNDNQTETSPPPLASLSPDTLLPESVSFLDLCDNPPCPKVASIVCGICNEAPYLGTDPQVAQYCSSECQKKHLRDHIKLCDRLQDRMTLFRVMGVAQKALYVYREMSWHAFEIEGVEQREDVVVLKGTRIRDILWPESYRYFPHELLPARKDREALLSFFAGRDAVICACEWIQGLLGGIVMEITKVIHQVKDVPRKLVLVESLTDQPESEEGNDVKDENTIDDESERKLIWEERQCEVLKVTLRSGEEYAIDLAGAQYGYFDEAVIDWKEYEKNCIVSSSMMTEIPPIPHGAIKPLDYRLSKRIEIYHRVLDDKSDKELLTRHLESLNLYLMEWQFDGGLSLKKLWELPEAEYRVKAGNLIDYLEWKFCRYVKPNVTARGRVISRILKVQKDWNFNSNFE